MTRPLTTILLLCFIRYSASVRFLYLCVYMYVKGWDSSFGRVPGLWLKGCRFHSWPQQWENFLLQSLLSVLTFIQCPFHSCVTAMDVKDTSHSAKSAGGRLHLNTQTPLIQPSRSWLTTPLSRHSVGTYQEIELARNSSGTLGHNRLSSLSHSGLIMIMA